MNKRISLNLQMTKRTVLSLVQPIRCGILEHYKVVEALGSERLEEFTSYYLIDPKRKTASTRTYVIQDYINGTLTIPTTKHPYQAFRWK